LSAGSLYINYRMPARPFAMARKRGYTSLGKF
jgi:hypothetical protein